MIFSHAGKKVHLIWCKSRASQMRSELLEGSISVCQEPLRCGRLGGEGAFLCSQVSCAAQTGSIFFCTNLQLPQNRSLSLIKINVCFILNLLLAPNCNSFQSNVFWGIYELQGKGQHDPQPYSGWNISEVTPITSYSYRRSGNWWNKYQGKIKSREHDGFRESQSGRGLCFSVLPPKGKFQHQDVLWILFWWKCRRQTMLSPSISHGWKLGDTQNLKTTSPGWHFNWKHTFFTTWYAA